MQTPTNQIVDQAIEKLDAQDAGIVDDTKTTKDGENDQKKEIDTKETDTNKSESREDDKKQSNDSGDDKSEEEVKDDKKEGEFTADDALEVDAPKDSEPEVPKDNAGIVLSPQERQYIADNIGEPIVIKGYRGTGDNVKEVEIKAYSPADIPADFKFANDQQLAAASTGFQSLERKANDLLGSYRQNQTNASAREFEQRENEGIRADVSDLQKEGRFPKFTVRPGDKGFDESPEAKQMAEVLQIMSERNEMYLKQYNQGRPYKHIGFSEAFDVWEKQSSKKAAETKANEEQDKEDKERHEKGSQRSEANRSMSPYIIQKPTVKPGTTTRDILNRIDNEDF